MECEIFLSQLKCNGVVLGGSTGFRSLFLYNDTSKPINVYIFMIQNVHVVLHQE